jgi:hypothetical protein
MVMVPRFIYDRKMDRREQALVDEGVSKQQPEAGPISDPPIAYIPACGTLCDAFWWARRGTPIKPPE